jgi:hypothetical protein
MADAFHQFGSDLQLGPGGDIATVTGTQLGQQRVLRRLLTNPGDYIWQLPYGAGLGQFVGQPTAAAQIQAITLAQMTLEAAVSQSPAPVVSITAQTNGTVTMSVQYADAQTGATVTQPVEVAP